jgi:tetratricopeptide (TPR) repeat protein
MKYGLLLMLLCLNFSTSQAQTSSKNDEMKMEADYYLMLKDYGKALDLYLKIVKSEPGNADIKHRIGICYLNSETDKARAIPYLEEAVQKVSVKYNPNSLKEENASFEAIFALGSAYRVNNELDKAIEAYTRFKEYIDKGDAYNLKVADQYIRDCKVAIEMQKHPVNFNAINLGAQVNDPKPNFNAVVSGDGKTMVYTSPGRQGYEIFLAAKADTGWTTPKNITSVLGTGKFMKTSDLSFDGNTLLLVLEDPENSDIYFSLFEKGRWGKAQPLGKNVNSKMQETHASLSTDNNTLYFTSNRKGGQGDLDLYVSALDAKGEWGKAVNMGPVINTPFNEETPFVSDDGQYLYYSSEGLNGLGGYDIYRFAFRDAAAQPVNLGFPVNTTDNNLFYCPVGDGHTAYYAFAGADSYGGRDIYLVSYSEPRPEPEPEPEVIMAAVPEIPPAVAAEEAVIEVPEVPVEEAAEPMYVSDTEVQAEPESFPENEYVPASEPEQEPIAESSAVINTEGMPLRSYTIQIMALRKPVDLSYFKSLPEVRLVYSSDKWFRYTVGLLTQNTEAEAKLRELVRNGFTDAFIRGKPVLPRYTIQIMAVPGPVVDLTRFADLDEVCVSRGSDQFCRYTTGEFETLEEARAMLDNVKRRGYPKAFVRKVP